MITVFYANNGSGPFTPVKSVSPKGFTVAVHYYEPRTYSMTLYYAGTEIAVSNEVDGIPGVNAWLASFLDGWNRAMLELTKFTTAPEFLLLTLDILKPSEAYAEGVRAAIKEAA